MCLLVSGNNSLSTCEDNVGYSPLTTLSRNLLCKKRRRERCQAHVEILMMTTASTKASTKALKTRHNNFVYDLDEMVSTAV